MLPPPLKEKKVEETANDIPDVLQGEIARLDQRFKVCELILLFMFDIIIVTVWQ
jgi:hypothetical protein